MVVMRQRYLICFYCGQKSSKRQDGTVRQWQCGQCEATNHLDEKGNITDPPVPMDQPTIKYTQPMSRTPSSDEFLFCNTCLKNQQFFTQALSKYLPSPTDPHFALYESAYPVHLQNLEQRYPQVCETCEPRVKERIRNAGYLAKTDHLRRMLHRSKGAELGKNRWECGWRGMVLFLGALAWWGSHLLQCIWHIQQMLTVSGELFVGGGGRISFVNRVVQALAYIVEDGLDGKNLIRGTFILGGMSVWWNNRLMGRLRRSDGRLEGLKEYYKLQVMVWLMRVVALWVLGNPSWKWSIETTALKGAHALALGFIALTTFISLRTVKLVFHPRVSFQGPIGPLIERRSNPKKVDFATTSSHQQQQNPFFPFDKLGRANPAERQEDDNGDYHLLTPPPEVEEEDRGDPMDWTPNVVQKQFEPTPRPTLLQKQQPIPSFSTFQRLPPAPKAPAAILRNAVPNPSMPVPTKQGPFFQRYDPIQYGLFPPYVSKRNEMEIHPQRLFMEDGRNDDENGSSNDTISSLLGRFSSVFTLSDEPVEVKVAREEMEEKENEKKENEEEGGKMMRGREREKNDDDGLKHRAGGERERQGWFSKKMYSPRMN
ncbi:MAG: hypothetical protein M1823_006189 [Watsoniomyces obsoletus]|nr:MAG: hypothetical protein M1823_006189 [Watsoniomyces obsoletus]